LFIGLFFCFGSFILLDFFIKCANLIYEIKVTLPKKFMHISLRIFPVTGRSNLSDIVDSTGSILGTTVLRFDEDWRIFGQIMDVSEFTYEDETWPTPVVTPSPLPNGISLGVYEEEGLEYHPTSPLNDERLCYLTTKEFRQINLPGDATPTNKAIFSFIREMPDDTKFVLYWE
jgi:hypothetical protein